MKILNTIKNLFNKTFSIFNNYDDIVNYIFTSDSLPAPLDDNDEKIYIDMFGTINDEYARSKLIEHNLRLVLYIAKKFESPKAELEDLVSVGAIGLVKAVDSFKADKNIKLATYASRCIENEILMYLRKVNKTLNEISLDEPLSVDDEGSELVISDILPSCEDSYQEVENDDQKKFLLSTLSSLSKRERDIMIMRYGLYGQDELTQKEVADLLSISQSYISRLEKKILKKLKTTMMKN
ncbi:MAG: sigma-70 family RNA polymerase sigma factor [Clostridia bacterium]